MTPFSLARQMALAGLGVVGSGIDLASSAVSSFRAAVGDPWSTASHSNRPFYDAAGTGRRFYDFPRYRVHPNVALAGTKETLTAATYELLRRDGFFRRGFNSRIANLIGTGITPQSQVEDDALQDLIHARWDQWIKKADADGIFNYYGLQKQVARTVSAGGEVFVRRRLRRPEDGLTIPLQLQLLSGAYCPIEKNETLPNGAGFIRQGAQFGPFGNLVGWWLTPFHPYDDLAFTSGNEPKFVPASEILHIFDPMEPGQIRGEPENATALMPTHGANQYDDFTMERAKTSSVLSMFIERTQEWLDWRAGQLGATSAVPTTGTTLPTTSDTGRTDVPHEAGMILAGDPGEKWTVAAGMDLGATYEPFQKNHQRRAAAGQDNMYENVTGDFAGVTFSSIRAGTNDHRLVWDQKIWTVLNPMFDERVWEWWFEAAVLAGALLPLIDARRFARERDALMAVRWVPSRRPAVNPLEDTQTQIERCKARLTSRSAEIRADGENPREVARQIAKDEILFGPLDPAQPVPAAESTGQRAAREEAARPVKPQRKVA